MISQKRRGVPVLGVFHLFCTGFFPSLQIYLPVVFVVGDFWMGYLSGCFFLLRLELYLFWPVEGVAGFSRVQ